MKDGPPLPAANADPSAANSGAEAEKKRPKARSWRRVFEDKLRPLEVDARVRLARGASEVALRALCFDPSFKVIQAVLNNSRTGLEHARLIAEHHRTSIGLDALGKRAPLLRDTQVQRHLFRNPQMSPRLLRQIFQMRRLADLYQLCMSRESTERVRVESRKEFRRKFASGSAEERVTLILRCEGRCLNFLRGVPLGARAAALLSQRTFQSTLLVQNLSRWSSTPPAVLLQMSRSPLAKRSPALRNLISRHPNAPAQLKIRS